MNARECGANCETARSRRPTAGTTLDFVSATSLLQRILEWLRAGYPEGVPGVDCVPLLALLRPTALTEDEVKEVVRHLTASDSSALADGEITRDEIAEFIADVTHRDAAPEDVQRVAARLAAAGWALAGMEGSPPTG